LVHAEDKLETSSPILVHRHRSATSSYQLVQHRLPVSALSSMQSWYRLWRKCVTYCRATRFNCANCQAELGVPISGRLTSGFLGEASFPVLAIRFAVTSQGISHTALRISSSSTSNSSSNFFLWLTSICNLRASSLLIPVVSMPPSLDDGLDKIVPTLDAK
jgi:hypothetical protein